MEDEFQQTIKEAILSVLRETGELSTAEITELVPTTRNYIRTVLNRAERKDLVSKKRDPNDLRVKLWTSEEKEFRKYTFTLRIIDTSSKHPTHRYDFKEDVEATISGVVPIDLNEDEIKEKLIEELKVKMLTIMDENDMSGFIALPLDRITFKEATSKGISGVELGEDVDDFDPENRIEISFTNNIGKNYIWNKTVQKRIEDFG